MEPGKYIARISDYGISETKSHHPQISILFEFKDDKGNPYKLTWYGTLKEGRGREITIDSLLKCEFKGNNLDLIAGGPPSNILNMEKDLEIDIERHEYEGKAQMRIQWVNLPGGSGFRNKLNEEGVVQSLKGMKLQADVMARRQEIGIIDGQENSADPDDDIPF